MQGFEMQPYQVEAARTVGALHTPFTKEDLWRIHPGSLTYRMVERDQEAA